MKNSNKLFFSYIFPSIDTINYTPKVNYDTNNIQFCSGIIYGNIGSGKSELFRSLTEQAVNIYGKNNVYSSMVEGDLSKLILYGLSNKLINILLCDDITLEKIDREELKKYFRLRHILKYIKQVNKGYILSMLGVHRFHGVLNTELRTNLDFIIFKTIPSNPYDYSIVRKFIGDKGIKNLIYIEKNSRKDPSLKKYSVYWTKTRDVGILELPLASKNYVKEL